MTKIITLTNEEREFLCALDISRCNDEDGWTKAGDLARELDAFTEPLFDTVARGLMRFGIIDYQWDGATGAPDRVRLNSVNWAYSTVTADHVKFMEALAGLQEKTGRKLVSRSDVKKALQWTPDWFIYVLVSLEMRRWISIRHQWKNGENEWLNFNPAGRDFLAGLRKEAGKGRAAL